MSVQHVPGERGAVTVFVAVAALGLLALAGLVVDGAAKVRAVQRADRVAAEAARAAGQAVDRSAVLAGTAVRVDRRAALMAAEHFLDHAGIEGAATVAPGGRSIEVTTATSQDTVLLGLIGISSFHVTGQASVALVDAPLRSQP
ncbi:MAG TPA: hypothetical protein VF143_03065 [Candidatus Nanopelagicales bacterium]